MKLNHVEAEGRFRRLAPKAAAFVGVPLLVAGLAAGGSCLRGGSTQERRVQISEDRPVARKALGTAAEEKAPGDCEGAFSGERGDTLKTTVRRAVTDHGTELREKVGRREGEIVVNVLIAADGRNRVGLQDVWVDGGEGRTSIAPYEVTSITGLRMDTVGEDPSLCSLYIPVKLADVR
jgi:hypothetical protein